MRSLRELGLALSVLPPAELFWVTRDELALLSYRICELGGNSATELRPPLPALYHPHRPEASEDDAPGRGAGGEGREGGPAVRGGVGERTPSDVPRSGDRLRPDLQDERVSHSPAGEQTPALLPQS